MRHNNTRYTIGIDEAGRGPLAGPVAVGVVAVGRRFDLRKLNGIRDSKQLSKKQREEWFVRLTAMKGLHLSVSMVGPTQIDRKGIVPAVRLALSRSLRKLSLPPSSCHVLLDGALRAPEMYTSQETVIHGDATEPLISAASVLAKVTRDRFMVRNGRAHPFYGFEVHKGYGTAAHRKALRRHGLSDIHRKSFCGRFVQK